MAGKDNQGTFRSLSGQAETAEPSNGGINGSGMRSTSRKSSSTQLRQSMQSSSSGPSVPTLRKSSSANLTSIAAPPAPGASPRTSRNASPIRQDKPPTVPGASSTQPSAAAIQRALSASSVPQLQPKGSTSDAVVKLPVRVQKSAAVSGETTPQWPISPRLKSPPPSGPNSRRGSAAAQQRTDLSNMPSIQVMSATPQNNAPVTMSNRAVSVDSQWSDVQLQAPPPPKSSARGASGKSTLETVQENIGDMQESSPAVVQAAADLKPLTKIACDEPKKSPTKSETDKYSQLGESGSESAGNKSDSNKRGRRQSTGTSSQTTQSQPPAAKKLNTQQQKPSHSSGPTAKERQAAGKQNMTVETEVVQSIPQSQLAPANDRLNLRNESSGTVKLKPSNETIRPKKERKKAAPKTRSVNQGTATSKADLFEARVASAVDEANTSDSDETFVYESNPPEQPRRHRHHSRTPSVTSSHSMADQQRGVGRAYNDPFDGPRVGGKRSMKFSTNPTNPYGMDSPDSNNGTVRMHTPKHIGKFGRGGNQSASHDQDSPFTQASKLRNHHLAQGRSRPTSLKSPQNMQFRPSSFFSNTKKQEQPYDFDAGQTADDERTPLMGHGTVRTPRRSVYHPHRFSSSVTHSMDNYYNADEEPRSCCGMKRWGGCLLATLVLILVVISALGFVFASNRPLYDVKVHKIQNVLASESELMLDLLVGAVNPNTLGISVSDLDVNVFAKSKHVTKPNETEPVLPTARQMGHRYRYRSRGSGSGDKNPNPIQDPDGHWHNPGDKEREADPETDAQTLLLGRVFHFDQALVFEASPLKQHEYISSGQLRLTKPGNRTESRGSAKWEEIIQYPFELIVRGTIKYQLPISSRLQSVAIGAKTVVHPEEDLDSHGNMKTAPVDPSENWQWVELPEEEDSLGEKDEEVSKGRIEEVG